MEEKLDPKLEAHRSLLAEIGLAGRQTSSPHLGLGVLESAVRFRGVHVDAEEVQAHHVQLAALERYGKDVERSAGALPLLAATRLREMAQVMFAEMILSFLGSPDGTRALGATAASVRAEAEKQLKAADDARHEGERCELAQREARLAGEIGAMNPMAELNKIAAAGVALSVDPAGVISAVPSGRLDFKQRRMIDSRRDEVVELLRARQQAETL
jgi:hypothetical protein